MGLQTFVKVGEVTNLSDARYCAGMGVDLLGFNVVEGTQGYVDPEKFKEITGWVVGVEYCAEIGDFLPPENLISSIKNADINYVESTSEEVLLNISDFKKIFKVIVKNEADLVKLRKTLDNIHLVADYLLLESDNTSMAEEIDLLIQSLSSDIKILKGFGLNEGNISTVIDSNIEGIALKGSEEIKPGYKDFDELAEILEALEED